MKLRSVCFLILLLLPIHLFGGVNDLEEWIENGMTVKTPAGAKEQGQGTKRIEFKPKTQSEKQLYSERPLTGDDAATIFMSGAVLEGSSSFFFLQGAAKDLSAGFAEIRTTLANQRASQTTLEEFDRYAACVSKLPYGTPWEQWTPEQKNSWNNESCEWASMNKSILKEFNQNPEAYFFYWLGIDTFRLAAYVPHAIQKDGKSIQDLMNDKIVPAVNGFSFAQTDPVAQRLTLEAANAIRTIAGMKQKVDQGQITQTDVDTMQSAATVIMQAGSKFLLVR